ncbi:MAG: ATP synthase subunit beta [Paracoccaceae bacterium]|nr:MAG: ATP synthase subunit beta [Paracoccaceae bacterium]
MSLTEIIARRIAAEGPMPLSEYMALCLGHPRHGYYMTRDPLGPRGDFTTAPEISQMFGEVIGLALAQAWLDRGSPSPFCLAELGPGRGTLMADILRATARVPGFHDAMRLVLVETSPQLRAAQARTLAGRRVDWADSPDGLPDLPLFLVANEFFDALPIRQYHRTAEGWRERVIALDQGRLVAALSPPVPLGIDAPPGTVLETSPPGEAIAEALGARLVRHGGLALIIDYGEWEGTGDTFQAVSGHGFADPLERPGEADLTAHVQFGALAMAAADGAAAAGGRVAAGFREQGAWLVALGIGQRAAALARARPDAADAIADALERLTHPDQMGTLFKVLALTRAGDPAPPGLAEAAP